MHLSYPWSFPTIYFTFLKKKKNKKQKQKQKQNKNLGKNRACEL